METKLFSIVLCLLVLETSSLSLKNLTSTQHRTEKAFARMLAAAPPFNYFGFADNIYTIVSRYVRPQHRQNQFAFLMIVGTQANRYQVPGRVANFLQGNTYLPSLQTWDVWPTDAQSNLVIAGVTYPKPRRWDIPYHAEQKLINEMEIMDAYDTQVNGGRCPWLIMLGSHFDTCCGRGRDGNQRCTNRFVSLKRDYVRQTGCRNTRWLVYVGLVRKWGYWVNAKYMYAQNNIMASQDRWSLYYY